MWQCIHSVKFYDINDYEPWIKHKFAAIQNNQKPNIIKDIEFLRWNTNWRFTLLIISFLEQD